MKNALSKYLLAGTASIVAHANGETRGSKTKKTDTFFDSEDNQVASIEDIGAAYKLLCEFEDMPLKPMTDAQAGAIVMTVHGDGKDVHVKKARLDALSNAEPTAETHKDAADKPVTAKPAGLKTVSAVPVYSAEAIKWGRMIDATFSAHLKKAADAKEDLDGAPLLIAGDLTRTYSNEDLLAMPEPGSGTKKWKESHPHLLSPSGIPNVPTDHYKTLAADGTEISGTVYGDMLDASELGKGYVTAMDQLDAVKTLNSGGKALDNTPETFIALKDDVRALEATRARYASRRGNTINKLRKGVQYVQQCARLKELPAIGVRLANKDMDIASKMPKPIILYRKDVGEEGVAAPPVSLSTFIRYDVAAAAAAGGLLPHLTSTIKREKKKGQGKKGGTDAEATSIGLPNAKQAIAYANMLNQYFGDDDRVSPLYVKLNTKGEERVDALKTIFALKDNVDALCAKFAVPYQDMIANETKLHNAVAANNKAA